MTRPNFNRHELTHRAYDALKMLPKGQMLGYAALRKALGCDPQVEGYVYVKSARDMLARDGVGVFWAHEGDGIRHLTDEEVAILSPRVRRKRVRGQIKRLKREANTVQLALLSADAQASLTAALATAQTIEHATNFRFVERQQAAIVQDRGRMTAPPLIPQ